MNAIAMNLSCELCKILHHIYDNVKLGIHGELYINRDIIIGGDGDVNFKKWHNGALRDVKFKFDGKSPVYIKTEEQAERFKNIILKHFKIDLTALSVMEDNKLHNSHYMQLEHEPNKVIKDWVNTNQLTGYEAYCCGQVIKYLSRLGLKESKQKDLDKAQYYLNEMRLGSDK